MFPFPEQVFSCLIVTWSLETGGPGLSQLTAGSPRLSLGYTRTAGTLIPIFEDGLVARAMVEYIMHSHACLGLLDSARTVAHHRQEDHERDEAERFYMRTRSQTRGVPGRRSGALAESGKLRQWRVPGIGRSRTMRQSPSSVSMHVLPPLKDATRIGGLAGDTPLIWTVAMSVD